MESIDQKVQLAESLLRGAFAEKSPVRKAAYAFQAAQIYQDVMDSDGLISPELFERGNIACNYAMYARELIQPELATGLTVEDIMLSNEIHRKQLADEANRLHAALVSKNAELIRLFRTYGRQIAPDNAVSPLSCYMLRLSGQVQELILRTREVDFALVPLLSVDEGKLNVIESVENLDRAIRSYNL